MKRYEVLNEAGAVVNTIIADLAFMQQVYGESFREAADQVDAVPAEDPSAWFISKDKFNARMTTNEAVAIEIAQLDNPQAPMSARQLAAAMRVAEKQKSDAVYLDLTPNSATRARIEAGLNIGKQAGIFTDARIAELMVKPTEAERYRGQGL